VICKHIFKMSADFVLVNRRLSIKQSFEGRWCGLSFYSRAQCFQNFFKASFGIRR